MLTVYSFMIGGFILGFALRKNGIKEFISKMIMTAIITLIFMLGLAVGGNKTVINNLANLGGQALLLAILSTFGSVIAAWAVAKLFFKKK